MRIVGLPFFVVTTMLLMNCSHQSITKKNNPVVFRQLFAVKSFDSAIVNFGEIGDTTTGFVTNYDFSPIGEAINSATGHRDDMLWKGSFWMILKKDIVLKVSYYGSFFSERSTGLVFIVPNEYSEKFKYFVKDMFAQTRDIRYRQLRNSTPSD